MLKRWTNQGLHGRGVVVLTLVFALVLGACGPGATPTEPPTEAVEPTPAPAEPTQPPAEPTEAPAEPELEITELPLHFQPGDVAFAPQAIALHNGWYEEAGFETVETVNFTAGALAGEALLAGAIYMWTPGNLPVIAMRHNGLPVVVLGNVAKTWPEVLVVGADSGIEDPADLEGKRVALLQGSTASAVLSSIASHYGLDESSIEVVNLPPPEQVTALANGEVDAMINFFRFNYQARDEHGATFRVYKNESFFASDEGSPIQATHTRTPMVFWEDFVRDNPNTVRALLSVMLRAQVFLNDPANRDEAIRIFAEVSEIDEQTAAIAWDDLTFDPTIGQGYLEDMQAYTDFLVAAGRVTGEPIDPADYLYTGPLSELAPEYVEVEGSWQP